MWREADSFAKVFMDKLAAAEIMMAGRLQEGGAMRWRLIVVISMVASAFAQESAFHADFRREGEQLSESCGELSNLPTCAYLLFTDHPVHIAAGSLPSQNGFGLGGAFVTYKNTKNWRLSWDVDAVGTTRGSWRAGGYMKLIHTPVTKIKPITLTTGGSSDVWPEKIKKPGLIVHPYTVFNLYAQSTALNKLYFFGLGNDSALAGQSVFGMTETIAGGNVIKPVYEWSVIRKLNLALLGEVNGRFVSLRGDHGQSTPSIETLYTNAAAPGVSIQPAFVQLGEGFRIRPGLFGDHVRLNYVATFQQFIAPSNTNYSFLRWTVDLNHTVPIYAHTQSYGPKDTNGPDECALTPGSTKCAPISFSRNLSGSIGVRFLLSESINSATGAVPFYFQQTLGGADINGAMALGSYQDYRFRAPNLLLLQESVEHSIWGPIGLKLMADQGRVALTRGDVGFDHLKYSFAAGLTLRAGGFPMVSLMFAWGGSEGHHNIFNMNNSLLGGSSRPLLD
jgi:hypothetical protein